MFKIFTVCPYAPVGKGFGGIARSSGAYLAALSLIGYSLISISSTSSLDGEVTAEAMSAAYPNAEWWPFRVVGAEKPGLTLMKRWGISFGFLKYLFRLPKAEYVFLHGILSWPTILTAITCRSLGKPYFVIGHATLDTSRMMITWKKHPIFYGVVYPILMWSASGARAIIVSGRLESDALPSALKKRNVVEIENFFDFIPNTVRLPPKHVGKTYLFVGRVEPDKGILKFLRIWEKAASPDSRLVIVGSGLGRYAKKVEAAAKRNPMIRFAGEVSQACVANEMEQADIVVLPTGLDYPVTENFGNVIVEAFIAGRPVMVTEGLHWDNYADSPAIVRFARDDESVAAAIQSFEATGEERLTAMMHEAGAMALRFHVSVGAKKIQQLLAAPN